MDRRSFLGAGLNISATICLPVRGLGLENSGLGNIRFMLETGDLSGKCADLNALYVALCRSIGILAGDVYGVRVANSRYGYKSLGRSGHIESSALPRRSVADGLWLGAGRSRRRSQSRSRGNAGIDAKGRGGRGHSGKTVRRLGDELDAL